MKLKSIHHAAIICSDYDKSKKFYSEVLGLSIVSEFYREQRDSYKLDLALPDGSQIELFSFAGAPARLNYPEALGLRHLAFAVESVEQAVQWLATQGLSAEEIRIDEYTGKKYSFFKDPDGLPLEIYEPS